MLLGKPYENGGLSLFSTDAKRLYKGFEKLHVKKDNLRRWVILDNN